MLVKCVAKFFALKPQANSIEASIIAVLVLTALVSALLAVREPLASFYSSVVGDFMVGSR